MSFCLTTLLPAWSMIKYTTSLHMRSYWVSCTYVCYKILQIEIHYPIHKSSISSRLITLLLVFVQRFLSDLCLSLIQKTLNQTVSKQGLKSWEFRTPPFQLKSRNQVFTGLTLTLHESEFELNNRVVRLMWN